MNTFKPEIIFRAPETLTPYVNNSKTHPTEQIDKIAGQIAKFGFDQPIVIDQNGVIIKGHGRREAAIRLGLKAVPVIISTLDDHAAMAARIGDNKVAESSWDNDILKFEFGTLENHGIDIPLHTGFDETEIKHILDGGWEGGMELLEGVKETSDSMSATIKIKCPPNDEETVRDIINAALAAAEITGIEVV